MVMKITVGIWLKDAPFFRGVDVTVTDAEKGTRLKSGTMKEEGDGFNVKVPLDINQIKVSSKVGMGLIAFANGIYIPTMPEEIASPPTAKQKTLLYELEIVNVKPKGGE